jgi:putative transcriptional regulator
MSTVILSITEAAKRKGIENPFALSRETGIGYAICHRLWSGKQSRIDLATIARLCDTLECQPGDLLIYMPDKKKSSKK